MPRIAIITHEYYPVLSGGTVFAEEMAAELTLRGWSVDILTASVGNEQPVVEHTRGFRVLRFRTARSSVSDSTLREHLSYFLLGLPQMFARARSERYDLLFSIFAIPSGLISLAMSKVLGVPYAVFVDAADTPGIDSAMRNYVRQLTSIFRLVTNRADGVVILEGLEDLAKPHILHSRQEIIPNGAVIPEQVSRPGTNGPRVELLSVGRLVFRKGFREIITALASVVRQRNDFHLRIIGYGRGEAEIRSVLQTHALADNVSLVGRVEYSDLGRYYLSSDAYLFYGDREGSSLAMISAAAYGLPIVASDHPGNRTFVEQGVSGYLVEHDNPESLARVVLQLLERRDALADMGRRSREIAERHSWAKIAERYDALFHRILSARSAH